MNIDLSFARAALVLPKEHSKIKIYIIGAGGTGSFAAPALARLAFELQSRGKAVDLTIIDPDRVEPGNIPRSNFCAAEIDRFKAQTLAERLSLAWGLEIGYACENLDYEKHVKPGRNSFKEMTILAGCVDNHLARREIHHILKECEPYSSNDAPNTWWVDGGNGKSSGQVLIGSTTKRDSAASHFTTAAICRKLPAPSLVHPELLEDQEIPARRDLSTDTSCPEMVRLGDQSLNINQRVAVEINEILTALLLTNSLKRFAAYFDLESGTSRSLYCTPDSVEKALREAAGNGRRAARKRKRCGGHGK